jgi:hypothetical protein
VKFLVLLLVVLLLFGGLMELTPKRKFQSGQANSNTLNVGAQTIASSVAYYTVTDRPLNTTFRNDTPRTIMVVVTAHMSIGFHAGSGRVFGISHLDASAGIDSPVNVVGSTECNASLAGVAGDAVGATYTLTFFVLPHQYYEVTTATFFGGVTGIWASWTELTLRN